MSVKHKAEAIAITCIDFRFQEMIDTDLRSRNLNGNCDRIAIAGASKNHEQALQQAQVSLRLHDPDKVLIYEHEDCGAYGQDNSVRTHLQKATQLEVSLRDLKPPIQVTKLFAAFDGIKDL